MHRLERTLSKFLLAGVCVVLVAALAAAIADGPHVYAKDHVDQDSSVNVDEPGRIPYQAVVSGSCLDTSCSAPFNPVPAGHRLVIRQVSGELVTVVTAPDTTKCLARSRTLPVVF